MELEAAAMYKALIPPIQTPPLHLLHRCPQTGME